MYNDGYFSGQAGDGGYLDYQSEYLSHSETFRRRLRGVATRFHGKGRLLDFGCAYGHLGHVAAQEGWDVVVADVAYEAVRRAVHDYGLAGFVGDLSKPPLKTGAFDLVTLYDVIEHVREPKSIIRSLGALLSGRGILHVTTPDVDSVSARLMGRRWYHYKPQEHLLYFGRRTLRHLLEGCGMRVEGMASAPSHMTVHDILIRLRRYSRLGANLLLTIARLLRLESRVVKIHIGEMQAWASPIAPVSRPVPPALCSSGRGGGQEFPQSPVRRLLSVLACPDCQGDLNCDVAETMLACSRCARVYEIRDRVPILLPKSEPARRSA